jgi:hypothetical protein
MEKGIVEALEGVDRHRFGGGARASGGEHVDQVEHAQ